VGIWDETNVDWSTGDGLLVSQLFERAYVDGPAARTLADAVGMAWPTTAATMSHSQLWTALLSAAAADRKLPALAAELLDDPTRAVFTNRLMRVLGDQVGLAHAVGVAKHGLPSSEEEKSAVVETLDFAIATEEILPSAGEGKLQAVNPGNAGLQSFSSYLQSLLNARRRVALIRRARSEVGSGFLVGPNLLLTAAHVLRSDGVPTTRDIDQLDVVMDFFDQGRSIDETGIPVPVVEMLRASPATDAELAGGGLPSWDARDDQLDYALLRLGRAIGNEAADDTPKRGWYRLDTAEPDLSRPALVIVLPFRSGPFSTSHSCKAPSSSTRQEPRRACDTSRPRCQVRPEGRSSTSADGSWVCTTTGSSRRTRPCPSGASPGTSSTSSRPWTQKQDPGQCPPCLRGRNPPRCCLSATVRW
jgi:hypothetical protein